MPPIQGHNESRLIDQYWMGKLALERWEKGWNLVSNVYYGLGEGESILPLVMSPGRHFVYASQSRYEARQRNTGYAEHEIGGLTHSNLSLRHLEVRRP